MDKVFEISQFNRVVFLKLLEDLSYSQLVKIPENYNNSIFWNIAHVVVTQQLLTYKLSGLPLAIKNELVEKYQKGTTPTENIDQKDIDYIKENILDLTNKVMQDYAKGTFKDYNAYTTSAKITLKSVEDALQFNAFHEGIHLGVILSLKKLI